MAKKRILRLVLWLLALPQIGVSLLVEILAPRGARADLDRCLVLIGTYGTTVPDTFVEAPIVAEDHRSRLHPGIDAIAIARAIWVRASSRQIQGASTIEQQYVRVVSNRYERTAARKLCEQVLALMLARRANKHAIASAYLAIAYYGAGCVGISGLKARFHGDLSKVSFSQALRMVAQLKYPQPLQPTAKWRAKIADRVAFLLKRVEDTAEGTANESLQRTFDPQPILLSQNRLRLRRR